ncbi:hypothetical protein SAMN05444320_1022 [Streptoalloteichus hindustanus]|uniref:Helix-turn-helix domain-containing protein n=2 Tax=Streptoalloteichus hindustanus TaxID=2017 RepID=A0A1M4XHP1_STRHI|nr:hypothetical protein SAMN05444320_1022 [Streptoalloteichus hindustanus]
MGAAFRAAHTVFGISQAALAKRVHYGGASIPHSEGGHRAAPEGFSRVAVDACGAGDGLGAVFRQHTEPTGAKGWSLEEREPLDAEWLAVARNLVKTLLHLDVATGGDDSAPLAIRAVATARRQVATHPCRAGVEPDVHAVIGELAEVAGWLAYDAGLHDEVRRLNLAARHHLAVAGDASLDLLVVQNTAMHVADQGRPVEALRLARNVLGSRSLSPRLECLFRIREARALAQAGADGEARRVWRKAVGLHQDGTRDSDPAWAWWLTEGELAWHAGMVAGCAENWSDAIENLMRCVELTPARARRGAYIHLAMLMRAQVLAGAWRDAEETLRLLWPHVGEVRSSRGRAIVRAALDHARDVGSSQAAALRGVRI